MAPSGRDIMTREPQMADVTKLDADSIVAAFFAQALKDKAAKKAEG
jgi:hypothetical protein